MMRGRLALVAALPLLILIAGQAAACCASHRPSQGAQSRLDARAAALTRTLSGILDDASRAAARARDDSAESARSELPSELDRRFEGSGLVSGSRYAAWSGSPPEPAEFGEPGSVRLATHGVRTSLLVRSRADSRGRTGVVSFVVDSRAGGPHAQDLLPDDPWGTVAHWDFAPEHLAPSQRFDAGPPTTLSVPWPPASSSPLGMVVLEEPDRAHVTSRIRDLSLAWAAAIFAAGLLLLLARRPGPIDGRRLVAVVAGVTAARAALAAGRSFEQLLPRSVGTASLYGRGDFMGWLGSPAALTATSIAAYLVLSAASAYVAGSRRRGAWASAGVVLASIFGLAAVTGLAASLVRDAQVRVPRLAAESAGTLLLAVSAAFVITGVATWLAAIAPRQRPGRLAISIAMVPVVLLFLAEAYRVSERIVEDRLRSDFAPLVREQSARRRSAVVAAVADAAKQPRVASDLLAAQGRTDALTPGRIDSLAYDLWIGSDLFHEGFASSLDLYDALGTRRGHFGFGFPQIGGEREAAPRRAIPGGPPQVETETVSVGAIRLTVVHAEVAIASGDGAIVGRVVGHILEDPGNLPFLPGNAPYLDALSGVPSSPDDSLADSPDYVLFDADGRVVLSTMHRPPTVSPELTARAAAGRTLDLNAGDGRYHVLPIAEGGRLHLLLAPAPTWLAMAADAVRLLILGLAIVGGSAVIATVAGGAPVRTWLDVIRGSFQRRLLATVLMASVVPLIGLSFFLRAYIDRRGDASLAEQAAALLGAARRVVEDYQAVGEDDPTLPPLRVNDETLWWLRRVVGQEIHVYEDGILAATSKPELFDSALLRARLPGQVDRDVVRSRQPFVVRKEALGALTIPVAYAELDEPKGPRNAVIAVPLLVEQRAFARSLDRLIEMLLLVTTSLVALLAASSAWIARSVGDPVRRLAEASRRIAGGDYGVRLASSSRDEMGSLVSDFNTMASGLAGQRADIERRRDYIETLLRHATTGVLSTDGAGRVVTINPAADALLDGLGAGLSPGDRLESVLGRGDAAAVLREALAAPAGPATGPVEIDLRRGDETVRYRIVRVPLPPEPGGAEGALILLDDVTSLMKSNQLAAWAEMARAIAHEIKNPLTPIQLSAEHIRRLAHDRGAVGPEIDACCDTIVRNVRELRDISGAFSTYARIPDLDLRPVDPAEFLTDVAAPYRAAPPHGVSIVVRADPAAKVLADPKVLGRAIVNLIENALQAMPGGGRLVLSSSSGENGEVILSVEDNGIGLAPDVRARLFEPYFSTKSSGTGLGLAIVRRIVLAHGGIIDVTGTHGGGSTFRIRLKASAAA